MGARSSQDYRLAEGAQNETGPFLLEPLAPLMVSGLDSTFEPW